MRNHNTESMAEWRDICTRTDKEAEKQCRRYQRQLRAQYRTGGRLTKQEADLFQQITATSIWPKN